MPTMETPTIETLDCSNNKLRSVESDKPKSILGETDEQQLLKLAKDMSEVFIAGDPCHPFLSKHIAHDFRGFHDLSANPMSALEFMQLIQQIRQLHGDRQFEMVDEQVHFEKDGDSDQGTVFQSVRYVIAPESLVRNAMRTSKWKRRNGIWVCFEWATFKNDALAYGNIAPSFER